mgnify:FL=1
MTKKKILDYTKYRKNFSLDYKMLVKEGDSIFYDGELVEDENKKYGEGERFINIGYNFKNSLSRTLSNLYPMAFKFRGKKVASIEGIMQGIKYKDRHIQNLILKYSGIDAYHTRGANSQDFWGNTGYLYWQGKPIRRDSEEYQIFVDEIFLSASKNPIYRRCLLATGDKYLLHHIGKESIDETVLTRFEFELRLNSLRSYLRDTKKD